MDDLTERLANMRMSQRRNSDVDRLADMMHRGMQLKKKSPGSSQLADMMTRKLSIGNSAMDIVVVKSPEAGKRNSLHQSASKSAPKQNKKRKASKTKTPPQDEGMDELTAFMAGLRVNQPTTVRSPSVPKPVAKKVRVADIDDITKMMGKVKLEKKRRVKTVVVAPPVIRQTSRQMDMQRAKEEAERKRKAEVDRLAKAQEERRRRRRARNATRKEVDELANLLAGLKGGKKARK